MDIGVVATFSLALLLALSLAPYGATVRPANEAVAVALNSSKGFFIQSAHAQDAPEPTPTDAPERKPRRVPKPTTAQKK